tara:strand:+ start:175 stop:297 length:123 start_codon:yes stop_codon:yes gene_type:complete
MPAIVFFTGIAVTVDSNLKQWDLVVTNKVVQHEINARQAD